MLRRPVLLNTGAAQLSATRIVLPELWIVLGVAVLPLAPVPIMIPAHASLMVLFSTVLLLPVAPPQVLSKWIPDSSLPNTALDLTVLPSLQTSMPSKMRVPDTLFAVMGQASAAGPLVRSVTTAIPNCVLATMLLEMTSLRVAGAAA